MMNWIKTGSPFKRETAGRFPGRFPFESWQICRAGPVNGPCSRISGRKPHPPLFYFRTGCRTLRHTILPRRPYLFLRFF